MAVASGACYSKSQKYDVAINPSVTLANCTGEVDEVGKMKKCLLAVGYGWET